MSAETGQQSFPYPVPSRREYDISIRRFTVTEKRICRPDVTLTADLLAGITIQTDNDVPAMTDYPTLSLIGIVGLFGITLISLVGIFVALMLSPILGLLSPLFVLNTILATGVLDKQGYSTHPPRPSIPSPKRTFAYIVAFLASCLVSLSVYFAGGEIIKVLYRISPALLAAIPFISVLRVGYESGPLLSYAISRVRDLISSV